MKKIFTILSILILTSCTHDKPTRVYGCTKTQQARVSEFVQNSIKSANNMSDEEMEDVISQLENTAIKCNCSQYVVTVHYEGDDMGQILSGSDTLNYYRIF